VLVTVDSFRADAVCTGRNNDRTPEIGGLAHTGAVFENAFAHGNWTPFSFPAIVSSRPVFAESDDIGLPETPNLAEVLREAGIRTGGFNAANGFLTSHWGYDRGFDAFESFVADGGTSRYGRYLAAHPTVHAWLQLAGSPFRRLAARFRGETDERPFTDTSRLLDVEREAVEFLGEEPFFLWVHYMDAHTPYVPAPRYLRAVSDGRFETHRLFRAHARTGLGWSVDDRTLENLRALYRGAVRQVDASVGRLCAALSDAGVADETAILVASDHGEEFMEHGHLAHYPKLYDDLVHVPLILSAPGVESRRVRTPVGLDSIPPTVCDLLDVTTPDAWKGQSLLATDGIDSKIRMDSVSEPAATVTSTPDVDPIVSVTVRGDTVTQQPIPRRLDDGNLLASARTAEWTYIENTATGERELYHRGDDPGHQHDRYAADADLPAVVNTLSATVEDRVATLGGDTTSTEVTEDVAVRLEGLGYR